MKKFILACILSVNLLSLTTYGEVRILTTQEPPTNFKKEGVVVGTTVDIVKEILKKLNKDTAIELIPWPRAMKIASTEKNIAIFTAGKTDDRVARGFHFIGPVMTRKHILWRCTHCSKKNIPLIESINDIKEKNYKVGSLRGDWRGKLFSKNNIEEVKSATQNIEKLLRGRIDLWVSSDIEAASILSASKIGGVNVSLEAIEVAYVIKEAPSYIMLSKDTPISIVKQWEQAFSALQETTVFNKLAEKWAKEINVDLAYKPNAGFYIK